MLFNLIKTSNKNKVLLSFNTKYSKFYEILKILLKYGIIYSFEIKHNVLCINNNKEKLYEVYHLRKVKYYSAYKLRSLINKNNSSIYIISTTVGILEGSSCIKINIGGYLVFILRLNGSIIT
jgi:ribosomal protein S8